MSVFGKTITIEGANDEDFAGDILSVTVFILANHPTESAPSVKTYWGYKQLNDGKTYEVWDIECEAFTLAESDQDEGDYRMLKAVLRKPYKRIADCTLDRQETWYKDTMPGFTPTEIGTYGITSPYPIPVSWTGMSDSLDKDHGQRKLSFQLTSVHPTT